MDKKLRDEIEDIANSEYMKLERFKADTLNMDIESLSRFLRIAMGRMYDKLKEEGISKSDILVTGILTGREDSTIAFISTDGGTGLDYNDLIYRI